MFFRDLAMKSNVTKDVSLAEVRLPVRLGHRDANTAFGEPFARQLAAAGLGTVTQVKAHEASPSEICGITMYLALTDTSKTAFNSIARMLEHLHAPAGSSVRLTVGGDPLVFGQAECLELSIDDEKASNADARRDLARTCASAMKDFAVSRGWSKRAGRTVFYFYGESFQRMQNSVTRLIEENPTLATATARRLA